MPTRFISMPDEEDKARPLRVDVKNYSGKEEITLILWIRDVKMALRSGVISLEHQRVSLFISNLFKRDIVGSGV